MAWLPGEGIPALISNIKNPVGIEVGTDRGYTTTYLLDTVKDLTLHGVDPYTGFTDWNGQVVSQDERDGTFRAFMSSLAHYEKKYIHHRKTSDDAASDFDDESVDFIFIDGLHTYEPVYKDLRNYYPKLKKGGLFCGHDYTNVADGVGKAVNEFAAELGVEIKTTQQDVWYWFKP